MPQATEGLTERQQQVLDFIIEHHAAFKICPTSREIQQRFGYASQNAAMSHIAALIRKGAPISKVASGRLVYHEPSERIPWEDVKPFLKFLHHDELVALRAAFFDKYPHLKQ